MNSPGRPRRHLWQRPRQHRWQRQQQRQRRQQQKKARRQRRTRRHLVAACCSPCQERSRSHFGRSVGVVHTYPGTPRVSRAGSAFTGGGFTRDRLCVGGSSRSARRSFGRDGSLDGAAEAGVDGFAFDQACAGGDSKPGRRAFARFGQRLHGRHHGRERFLDGDDEARSRSGDHDRQG